MTMERSIKLAFDRLSGEILDADIVFKEAKNAFEIRRQVHSDEMDLYCCECEQKLSVSTSKYDRIHFKHLPNADDCLLKESTISPQEIEKINKILYAKESKRHRVLKQLIAGKLQTIPNIDKTSIAVDNKFIVKDNGKRRPDVYCRYKDKELVFEIQLSDLSLRYILSRYNFYKKHGMYLIWILDNFDVRNQGQLERDIKYLTCYQNFFKLDEGVNDFMLTCEYKLPFLTNENKVLTKWVKKSIPLDMLTFDDKNYQVYFYNFDEQQSKVYARQSENESKQRQEERVKRQALMLSKAKSRARNLINQIKHLRDIKCQNFKDISLEIWSSSIIETVALNQELNLKNSLNAPALHYWIETADLEDIAFLEFILLCREIDFDLDEKDRHGHSVFQRILLNDKITAYRPIKALFKRGYQLTNEDHVFLETWADQDIEKSKNKQVYLWCDQLEDRGLVDDVFNHSIILFIIESARNGKIVGFNYKPEEWIAFANNAAHHHGEYWDYIELAFKRFGLWNKLIALDKKGTFQNKVQQCYEQIPMQSYDVDEVIKELFDDLYIEL